MRLQGDEQMVVCMDCGMKMKDGNSHFCPGRISKPEGKKKQKIQKLLLRVLDLEGQVETLQRDYPSLNIEDGSLTYRGKVYVEKPQTQVFSIGAQMDAIRVNGVEYKPVENFGYDCLVDDICAAVGSRPSEVLDRIKQLVADQADARLGRMVRAMPRDCNLERQVRMWRSNYEKWRDTPEEALEAAGIRDPRGAA